MKSGRPCRQALFCTGYSCRSMQHRLTPATAALLVIPPLLWAGNAVVGRMVADLMPPVLLNFARWLGAFIILLPLAGWVLRPGSGLWTHWRRYAVLGFLGVGCYNALQYLALQTSSAVNVTLVASSTPVWMLAIGHLWFGQRITPRQLAGAVLSIAGVLVVLSRGELDVLLALRLVPGDIYVLLAAFSWALYSWQMTRPVDPPRIRSDWAAFLMAQVVMGLAWSGLFAAGEAAAGHTAIQWGWPLAAALAYIVVGPAVVAYRCWGLGVQRAGPNAAGFFSNLTPLFAALMSTAFLGELPHIYHGIAFALIVGGIVVSSRR